MFLKALSAFLVSLHIISAPPPPKIPETIHPNEKSTVSIADEVYAELAIQYELDHVSVYYFDDNPKNTISINPQKTWDPASTVKLYVAMYAFDQVAAGNISLDQMVTVQDKNVVPSQSFSNGYSPLQAGNMVSVNELLDRMITQSGNVSYNMLLDLLDRTKITKYGHDLGLINSSVGAKLNLDAYQEDIDASSPGYGPNITNAADFGTAFVLINGKRLPGYASLFDMLARQKFNSMIPALLPKDITVAHKTGELDPYYHDGGIIVAKDRRYILSVFSDMGDPNVVAHISDLVYTTNTNIVGNNNSKGGNLSEEIPNAPLDPLLSEGEPQDKKVLAANTQNMRVPKFTASDLGIEAKDISGTLNSKQLPVVVIPSDSPLHFLVDISARMRIIANPFASIQAGFQ